MVEQSRPEQTDRQTERQADGSELRTQSEYKKGLRQQNMAYNYEVYLHTGNVHNACDAIIININFVVPEDGSGPKIQKNKDFRW